MYESCETKISQVTKLLSFSLTLQNFTYPKYFGTPSTKLSKIFVGVGRMNGRQLPCKGEEGDSPSHMNDTET